MFVLSLYTNSKFQPFGEYDSQDAMCSAWREYEAEHGLCDWRVIYEGRAYFLHTYDDR